MSTLDVASLAPAVTTLPSLSVIMPAHNEAATIARAVHDVLAIDAPWALELIVVDDGSTDGTLERISGIDDPRLLVDRLPVNGGKGSAVRRGVDLATGTHLVVFDADCEYAAADLPRMFARVVAGEADVVYGCRDFSTDPGRQAVAYRLGRWGTTTAANLLFGSQLGDLHTCLKLMPVRVFRSLELSESGFGLDSEITAELLRRGHFPAEVAVRYRGRSHAEGKKIGWRDGVECLKVLARVRRRGLVRGAVHTGTAPVGVIVAEPSLVPAA